MNSDNGKASLISLLPNRGEIEEVFYKVSRVACLTFENYRICSYLLEGNSEVGQVYMHLNWNGSESSQRLFKLSLASKIFALHTLR